ncbi:hypothetical protein [Prochlorococcus marinus]|uniref:hypothetical protein n=1 Tax=Prochlorococcus marinus TaxID=1219 RepID=UPI0022B35107|nr:hypothetical protein [Prochlorococcus marinus]
MVSKLTESQKNEILEGFRSGKTLTSLSKEFGCTPSTITRTVKFFLSDAEYHQLKGGRRKNNLKQKRDSNSQLESFSTTPLENKNSKENLEFNEVNIKDSNKILNNSEIDKSAQISSNDNDFFQEIIPLNTEIAWDKQKEVACIPLSNNSLPETVYMLVDKKVELEPRLLKDFAEWSFLSEQDQTRKAILLFSNQRSAKRSCSRSQRVLKVPNSRVFQVSCSYLLAKGITRLIIDDSLIALDA